MSAYLATPSYLVGLRGGVFDAPARLRVVVVSAVGEADGARGAAAALACAAAGADRSTLLIDVGGRAPRPTLVSSAAARRLEERLAARMPSLRAAARGEVCSASVASDDGGLAEAWAAGAGAAGAPVVIRVAPTLLQPLLDRRDGSRPTSILLRADLERDRPLAALTAASLIEAGFRVVVLKRRLGWVVERRAMFGALGGEGGGLSEGAVRRLLGERSR